MQQHYAVDRLILSNVSSKLRLHVSSGNKWIPQYTLSVEWLVNLCSPPPPVYVCLYILNNLVCYLIVLTLSLLFSSTVIVFCSLVDEKLTGENDCAENTPPSVKQPLKTKKKKLKDAVTDTGHQATTYLRLGEFCVFIISLLLYLWNIYIVDLVWSNTVLCTHNINAQYLNVVGS